GKAPVLHEGARSHRQGRVLTAHRERPAPARSPRPTREGPSRRERRSTTPTRSGAQTQPPAPTTVSLPGRTTREPVGAGRPRPAPGRAPRAGGAVLETPPRIASRAAPSTGAARRQEESDRWTRLQSNRAAKPFGELGVGNHGEHRQQGGGPESALGCKLFS